LTAYGIEKASCIDKGIIEKVCGHKLAVKQDKNQREYCGCVESIDIGTYTTAIMDAYTVMQIIVKNQLLQI